uniref:Myotubularin phosphatase domain-containing protein n=1 Tax=Macrostomum lignano TaxID=282301 RepID=A0A1I8JHC6_9PLAT
FRPLVAEPILEEESDYEAPEDSHSEPDAPSDSGPAAPSGGIGAAAPGPCDRRAASEPASGAGWHPVPPPLSARAHAPPPVAAVTPVAAAPQPLPTPVVETDGSWHLVVLSTALIAATAQQILSDLAGELSVFQLRDCLRRILGCVRGSSGGCCATLIGSGSCYSFIWFLNYYCFWRLRDLVTSGCGHCGCGGGNCWGVSGRGLQKADDHFPKADTLLNLPFLTEKAFPLEPSLAACADEKDFCFHVCHRHLAEGQSEYGVRHQIIWMAQVNSKQHEQSLLITHLLSRMQSAEYNASLIGEWPEFIAQLSSSIEQIILRDYRLCDAALDNESGQVCATYPPRIFLPTGLATKLLTSSASKQFRYPRRLSDLCCSAAGARVRGRLPLPALICQGRLLCRSATLSAWPTGEEARGSDKILLDSLCVSHIVDLTTESRPLLVPGTQVRVPLWTAELWLSCYADFRRLHLPYPGCDFFSNWPAVDGAPLRYDWTGQAATLRLNGRLPSCAAAIAWQEYRSWDLDRLTANYLLIMLGYLTESGLAEMAGRRRRWRGLLLHCLSGWDRTPLFVSLIRLLLWSEGLAHASLSPSEILRLCLGYDWFLWGHRLPDRLAKGQRILEYCFHFVGLAADLPELSMVSHYPLIAGGSGDHCSNPNGMTRAEKLRCVSAMFAGALRRSSGSAGVDEADGQAARLLVPTAASHWLALLPGPSWASYAGRHGRTLGTCVRAEQKPVAAAAAGASLSRWVRLPVAAEAGRAVIGGSPVGDGAASVVLLHDGVVCRRQELPVAAAGTACDFSRLLSIRAARLKKKCFSLGGTGLSFGPMWCRWSTNTVSTIDSDVVDMVTVR